MAVILKAVPLGPAGRQRQHRVLSVERLDRRLLIDTEHRRVGWRVHIQPNNDGRFALKVGIVGSHVAIEPLRLQSVLGPDPRHHHVRDRQRRTQLARAPMRRAVDWLTLQRPIQNPRLQPWGQLARALPGMATEQPRQPLLPKPFAPAGNKRVVAAEPIADVCPGTVRFQQQDQPRSPAIVRPTAPARRSPAQFPTFRFCQFDRASHQTRSYYPFTRYAPLAPRPGTSPDFAIALRIACPPLKGVAGIVMSCTPSSAKASRMALTTTASAGVQPPSPPALMPNGLVGDSTSTISVAKDGRLSDRGIP